jgi:hypothetical protein
MTTRIVALLAVLTITIAVIVLVLGGRQSTQPVALDGDGGTASSDAAVEPSATRASEDLRANGSDRQIVGQSSGDPTMDRAITGRVFDSAGAALEGVRIEAQGVASGAFVPRPAPLAWTASDPSGRFALTVEPAREYELGFSFDGYVSQRRRAVVAGDELMVVLAPGAAIEVRVFGVDDGAPIEDARIERESDPDFLPAFTGADGRVLVRLDEKAALIAVVAEGFVHSQFILERDVPKASFGLCREQRDGTLFVLAVDATSGRPIAGLVAISGSEQRECEALDGGLFRVECDLPYGVAHCVVAATGYRRQTLRAHAPQGDEPRTAIRVALEPGFTIRGIARSNGKPLEGALVYPGGGPPPRRSGTLGGTALNCGGAETDANGAFAIHGVPPEIEAYAAITARGCAGVAVPFATPGLASDEADAADERVVDLGVIDLAPGRAIRGRVLGRADRAPIAGATLRTTSDLPYESARTARSDGEGRFEIRGASDFVRSIEASARGFVTAFAPIPDDPDGDDEIEVELSRGATLRGIVTDRGGNPVAGARVAANSRRHVPREAALALLDTGQSPTEARTDSSGRFELEGLAEFPWWIVASRGEARAGMTLDDLPPNGEIALVLTDPTQLLVRLAAHDGARLPARIDYELARREDAVLVPDHGSSIPYGGAQFSIESLEPGVEYALSLMAPGFGRAEVAGIVLAEGETRRIDVVLPPTTSLRGVLRPGGDGLRRHGLTVTRSTLVLRTTAGSSGESRSTCDEQGGFRFDDLAHDVAYAARASLVLRDAAGLESNLGVDVEPGPIVLTRGEHRVVDLTYEEPAGARIAGRFEEASHRAYVAALGEHGGPYEILVRLSVFEKVAEQEVFAAWLDAVPVDGELAFAFPPLRPGRYRLYAEYGLTDARHGGVSDVPRLVPEWIDLGTDDVTLRIVVAAKS